MGPHGAVDRLVLFAAAGLAGSLARLPSALSVGAATVESQSSATLREAAMSEQIKDAAEAAAESSAQCFGLEGWRTVSPDPVRTAFAEAGEGEEFADVVEKIGFGRWTHIGDLAFTSVPISIEVYARAASPEFLVNVLPNNGYTDRYVLADDLPSVMRLLAEWAPAA
jgi:hypothetical protein